MGQLLSLDIIYLSSDVIFSKQMTDPPLTLPLELPYLQFPSFVAQALSCTVVSNGPSLLTEVYPYSPGDALISVKFQSQVKNVICSCTYKDF